MKHSVSCTITHHLALTPSLTHAINLLQLSHDELFDEIQKMLAHNPMLCLNNTYKSSHNDVDILSLIPDSSCWSLKHALYEQLLGMHFDEDTHTLGCMLIESLDEQGFLEERFLEKASLQQGLLIKNWLRQLEPKGIGAVSLKEAILWQLLDNPLMQQHPGQKFWIKFLEYDMTAPLALDRFKKENQLTSTEWSNFKDLSGLLCFNPAASFQCYEREDLIQHPDLVIIQSNDRCDVILNEENIPQLGLDQSALLVTNQRPLRQLIQEAKSFIKIVRTRFETLLLVARFIVEHQQEYFKQGPVALKRLILDDVAKAVGLHESTISRIISHKIIQTPFGLLELKALLSRGLKRNSGEDVSTRSIRQLIYQLVCHENIESPLSDRKIAEILKRQGFCIARRTVTKYRKQIELGSSIKRKTP